MADLSVDPFFHNRSLTLRVLLGRLLARVSAPTVAAAAAPVAAPARLSRRAMAAQALRGHAQALPAAAPGLGARRRTALRRQALIVLWAEFALIYLAIPLSMAFMMRPSAMWPMLVGSLAFSLLILERTPGWSWRGILHAPRRDDWLRIGIVGVGALVLGFGALLIVSPELLFDMPLHRTALWLVLLVAYPTLSVLPQELIWRSLFFSRYGRLFPSMQWAAVANGLCFGLAHLFFWSWVTVALTIVGGAAFAVGYLRAGPKRGLLTAAIMHAIAGALMFTLGLEAHFSHAMVAH